MNILSVFAIFAGTMFIALVAVTVMIKLLGLEASVIILLASTAFGGGAALIEYLTNERS